MQGLPHPAQSGQLDLGEAQPGLRLADRGGGGVAGAVAKRIELSQRHRVQGAQETPHGSDFVLLTCSVRVLSRICWAC